MKKLSKIKLTKLSKAELDDKQMNHILGGDCCACACHDVSSTYWNGTANSSNGYGGSGSGGNCICCCDGKGADNVFNLGFN